MATPHGTCPRTTGRSSPRATFRGGPAGKDGAARPRLRAGAPRGRAGSGDEAGADFSTLEIAHIGHTYESLLSLRLSLARKPLRYDTKADRYVAADADEAEVGSGGLLWQTHQGDGRREVSTTRPWTSCAT